MFLWRMSGGDETIKGEIEDWEGNLLSITIWLVKRCRDPIYLQLILHFHVGSLTVTRRRM